MTRIERYGDVAAFYDRVSPFLLEHEAVHCVQLGFRETLLADPHTYGDADPELFAALDGDAVVGVAIRTPPFNLLLSLMDAGTAAAFAVELGETPLPGLVGPTEAGAAFVALRPGAASIQLEERLFELTELIPPRPASGHLRWAEDDDRELLLEWLVAFQAEALPGEPIEAERVVERRRDAPGGFAFWDDGGPVSFAAFGSPTPNGMRIGPVYTPPERRGRGYASALTAAISEHVLATGRRFCFLATDVANPTSNSIYRRLGYRPVADITVWQFA